MATLKLLLAEIRYRKLNFLLSLLAVVAAATLFVAGPVLIDGYAQATEKKLTDITRETKKSVEDMDRDLKKLTDQTRKAMLGMGFNLLIVHQDTNMADFWAKDFASQDMPQEYVSRLANSPKLEHVAHLKATLHQKIDWRKRKVMLVGYLEETPQPAVGKKKEMGYVIKPGTAYVGYELWRAEGLKKGDVIDVLGETFTISKTLPEQGSKDDILIGLHLPDAQRVLKMPGRINQIVAVSCKCKVERLATIRKELEQVLPETKITEVRSIAQARAEQRDLVAQEREKLLQRGRQQRDLVAGKRAEVQDAMETLAMVVTPLVVLVCGVWIGLLALSNVRERRAEIGLLRALGRSSGKIAALFLGRAVLVGLAGGGLGYLLGNFVAQQIVLRQFDVTAPRDYDVLLWALLGAPLVCAVASYLPTLRAIFQDPAVVLRDA